VCLGISVIDRVIFSYNNQILASPCKLLQNRYLFSPGSSYEYYSTYSYVCVGQSAVLKPIIVGPQEQWRGGQQLHNPNPYIICRHDIAFMLFAGSIFKHFL
jgi:hypothetical protein